MLYLVCSVGDDRFAIATARVAEVLPLVYWKHVPNASHGVMGLLNYHRTPVPLLDLSSLILGHPAPARMHTRIVLVHTNDGTSIETTKSLPLLGLVTERVMGTLRGRTEDFMTPDDVVMTAPYLGPVLTDATGIIQRIEIDALLPPGTRTTTIEQCTSPV